MEEKKTMWELLPKQILDDEDYPTEMGSRWTSLF
jgi:hypothetical protein